jgi:hypothetical protein
MCDFFSWIETEKEGSKKLYYLTDDIIAAKWGEDCDFQQYIGHSSIISYFGIKELENNSTDMHLSHRESYVTVPIEIAREINAGNMRKMAAAYEPRIKNIKYNPDTGDLYELNGILLSEVDNKEVPVAPVYRDNSNSGLKVGMKVILGGHSFREDTKLVGLSAKYDAILEKDITSTGPKRINWDASMEKYIGSTDVITELFGTANTYDKWSVKVAGNTWAWHCENLQVVPE